MNRESERQRERDRERDRETERERERERQRERVFCSYYISTRVQTKHTGICIVCMSWVSVHVLGQPFVLQQPGPDLCGGSQTESGSPKLATLPQGLPCIHLMHCIHNMLIWNRLKKLRSLLLSVHGSSSCHEVHLGWMSGINRDSERCLYALART